MRYPDYREKGCRAMSRGMPEGPRMYGREQDDTLVEQQFHQHEARPKGYI